MRDWSEVGYVIDRSVWLSPSEAAEHFKCRTQTLYNRKHDGTLPEDFMMTDGFYWYIHKDAPLVFRAKKRTTR